MCGIAGVIHAPSIDVRSMTDRLRHRGPDAMACWRSPSKDVQLGHCRLAIIDLTATGAQPMSSRDGRFILTFNGEIYNFQALRRELEQLGRIFRGQSDTEVLLEGYLEWGAEVLQRLNGMFALAIYDRGDNSTPATLFLARDRVGEKPLYYAQKGERFFFASELKAMPITFEPNFSAINHYLAFGFIPDHLCIHRHVQKLPAGHTLKLDLQTEKISLSRYWSLPRNASHPAADLQDLLPELESLFADSVRQQLLADVPVGVFLSGGLDSSMVVAAAAQQSSEPIKTFTVRFPVEGFDESKNAELIASHFHTDHHVLPSHDNILDVLSQMEAFVDEPLGDSSSLPMFLISALTRQHVAVALGGDGGDELFGGYPIYRETLLDKERWNWLPGSVLRTVSAAASMLPAGVAGRNRLGALRTGIGRRVIWNTAYFDETLRRRLLTSEVWESIRHQRLAPEQGHQVSFDTGMDLVDSMTRVHFEGYLRGDFLVKIDRASMAHSLEVRAPFLDYRLVEFAFRDIPSSWKVNTHETRRLQRRLAERLLPVESLNQPKRGFSFPLDAWLRKHGEPFIQLLNETIPDFIRREEVNRLIHGQQIGRQNASRLYALLMLGISCRNLKAVSHAT